VAPRSCRQGKGESKVAGRKETRKDNTLLFPPDTGGGGRKERAYFFHLNSAKRKRTPLLEHKSGRAACCMPLIQPKKRQTEGREAGLPPRPPQEEKGKSRQA